MCLCIATPLAPPVHAQSSTSPTLDWHAHNIFDNADAPGIAIVEFDRNGVTAERYFGVDGHNNPITRDTPFIWGSISKSFTAVLIMQLAEQGTISLDDPITKYFPEFEGTAFGNNGATITNMLQHTSGLTALPKTISAPQANAVIDEVSHLKSVNPLGTWEYSNQGYALLQTLIERVTHTPSYSDYLNEHIGKISDSSPLLADVDSVVNDVPPGYAIFFGTLRPHKTPGIYPGFSARVAYPGLRCSSPVMVHGSYASTKNTRSQVCCHAQREQRTGMKPLSMGPASSTAPNTPLTARNGRL